MIIHIEEWDGETKPIIEKKKSVGENHADEDERVDDARTDRANEGREQPPAPTGK